VFDRFKFNRKPADNTIECPLCQEKNPEESEICSRCSYQLKMASHQQSSNVDKEEATELFDELLSDFEEDEEEDIVDWSRTTFTMDDVTIDVKQYGSDDSVVTKQKPSFAFTVDTPEPVVEEEYEDYELTPDDAPEFVTKFEMPEPEEERLEEIPKQQVDLIKPTSESSEDVEIVSAEEIPESVEVEKEEKLPESPQDIVADEEVSETPQDIVADEEVSESLEVLPSPPTDLPPPREVKIEPPIVDDDQEPMPIPPPPDLSMIDSRPVVDSKIENIWPWAQQEEWSGRDVAQKVKSAMEAAKSKNIAQATVILDDVGPHLGDRTKLVYPIGALLQRMGRAQAVDKLLEAALRVYPEDDAVSSAKAKLRP